jgi:CBS domain-containing protein
MSHHSDARVAGDIMDRSPLTVSAATSLDTLAHQLLDARLDGACVLNDEQHLRGVVTVMDLLFQEQPARPPNVFAFFDAVFSLERRSAREEFVRKLTGNTVADVMTVDVTTCEIDTGLDRIAELMVQQHLTVIPVVDADGGLLGVVDKQVMLKAAFSA